MKNSIFILFAIIISGMLTSFVLTDNIEFSSSYSFTRSGDSEPLINLKLHDDMTFDFTDNSNPGKSIKASGKYELDGRKIKLFDYTTNYPIADTWKKDKKYDCIKSRKALEFTRICH